MCRCVSGRMNILLNLPRPADAPAAVEDVAVATNGGGGGGGGDTADEHDEPGGAAATQHVHPHHLWLAANIVSDVDLSVLYVVVLLVVRSACVRTCGCACVGGWVCACERASAYISSLSA